jgi:hypothetical protein
MNEFTTPTPFDLDDAAREYWAQIAFDKEAGLPEEWAAYDETFLDEEGANYAS